MQVGHVHAILCFIGQLSSQKGSLNALTKAVSLDSDIDRWVP